MHWPRPGESFWALKCATIGASRWHTNPVCMVDGAGDTFGATSVSWYSQSPSVSWWSPSVSRYSGRSCGLDPHSARCLFIIYQDFTPLPQEGHRVWYFSRGTDMTIGFRRRDEDAAAQRSCSDFKPGRQVSHSLKFLIWTYAFKFTSQSRKSVFSPYGTERANSWLYNFF